MDFRQMSQPWMNTHPEKLAPGSAPDTLLLRRERQKWQA
jgi:hypothetical protein